MRKFSVYEQNQLRKYGIPEEEWQDLGEKPVEYATGHCEFDGLDFKVNQNVLIPRVESIDIVNMADKFLLGKDKTLVADVGCGSGALGIALKVRRDKENKQTKVVLVDISPEAIEVAKENWDKLIGGEKEILVADLLTGTPEYKYDLMMGNLPYIPSFRVAGLPFSVVDYEPHVALDGGDEGLAIIKRFLLMAKNYLKEDGTIILEIDYAHLPSDFNNFGYSQTEIIQDEFGQRRFVVLRF